jgi:hypothetical protein
MGFLGGLFDKLKQGLQKTREAFSSPLRRLFSVFRSLDDSTLEELETLLIGRTSSRRRRRSWTACASPTRRARSNRPTRSSSG